MPRSGRAPAYYYRISPGSQAEAHLRHRTGRTEARIRLEAKTISLRLQSRNYLPRLGLASHGAETVTAVHGPVAPRQERYLGVNATLGADRWMHLPLAAAVPSSSASASAESSLLATAGASASRAAAGLIGEPLGVKELLFAGCEYKHSATVPTRQVLV